MPSLTDSVAEVQNLGQNSNISSAPETALEAGEWWSQGMLMFGAGI